MVESLIFEPCFYYPKSEKFRSHVAKLIDNLNPTLSNLNKLGIILFLIIFIRLAIINSSLILHLFTQFVATVISNFKHSTEISQIK